LTSSHLRQKPRFYGQRGFITLLYVTHVSIILSIDAYCYTFFFHALDHYHDICVNSLGPTPTPFPWRFTRAGYDNSCLASHQISSITKIVYLKVRLFVKVVSNSVLCYDLLRRMPIPSTHSEFF